MVDSPQTQPLKKVRSFDVFDTLIARRAITPKAMFAPVEAQGFNNFLDHRSEAGTRVFNSRESYTLEHIYADLVAQGVYSEAEARLLHDLELQLEFDNCIPIQSNLKQVRDGDILVSDMYYTPEFIRRLLSKAGLHCDYKLFVTPAGKLSGTIWPELLKTYSISRHLGDNPQSDVVSPSDAGIQSRLSTLHRPTKIESLLLKHGQTSLARCIREARLAAVHEDEVHDYLHDRSCQLNFPLLVLLSRLIYSEMQALKMSRAAFVTRDCYNLKRVFKAMFTAVAATDFYSSRKCQRKGSPTYLQYLESLCQDTLLVELDTSCASLAETLKRFLEKGKTFIPTVFTVIFLDAKLKRYRKLLKRPRPPLPKIHYYTTTAKIGTEVGALWEILNFAPYPSVIDVVQLPESGKFHPVFQERSLVEEYQDPELVHTMNKSIQTCVALAQWEAIAAESERANLPVLLDALFGELSGCQRLLDIFPRFLLDAAPEEQRFFEGLGWKGRGKLEKFVNKSLDFVKRVVKNRRRLPGYVLTKLRSRGRLATNPRGRS